jgi:hypothetical protein
MLSNPVNKDVADKTHRTAQIPSARVQERNAGPASGYSAIQDLQRTIGNQAVAQLFRNRSRATGEQSAHSGSELPGNLKTGIEQLSGLSMDGVQVHYNSAQPGQIGAHAYAQGSEIHLAPGQERHLSHEAWHVVQQMQGRVPTTLQLKEGTCINDDTALETEADHMGAKAVDWHGEPNPHLTQKTVGQSGSSPIQGCWDKILLQSIIAIFLLIIGILALKRGIANNTSHPKKDVTDGGKSEQKSALSHDLPDLKSTEEPMEDPEKKAETTSLQNLTSQQTQFEPQLSEDESAPSEIKPLLSEIKSATSEIAPQPSEQKLEQLIELANEQVTAYRESMKELRRENGKTEDFKEMMGIVNAATGKQKISQTDKQKLDSYLNFFKKEEPPPQIEELVEEEEADLAPKAEDQFATAHPDAVRKKPMDSIKKVLTSEKNGYRFTDCQNFIASTFSKPSVNLPQFGGNTVYHDTKGGSDTITLFGVIVGADEFLFATGEHTDKTGQYRLDWVCDETDPEWKQGGYVSYIK